MAEQEHSIDPDNTQTQTHTDMDATMAIAAMHAAEHAITAVLANTAAAILQTTGDHGHTGDDITIGADETSTAEASILDAFIEGIQTHQVNNDSNESLHRVAVTLNGSCWDYIPSPELIKAMEQCEQEHRQTKDENHSASMPPPEVMTTTGIAVHQTNEVKMESVLETGPDTHPQKRSKLDSPASKEMQRSSAQLSHKRYPEDASDGSIQTFPLIAENTGYSSSLLTREDRPNYGSVAIAQSCVTPLQQSTNQVSHHNSRGGPNSLGQAAAVASSSKTAPCVDPNDPLQYSQWPMGLWARTRCWYLPSAKVLFESRRGKIVYWMHSVPRVKGNLALVASMWLARALNIPLVVVILMDRDEGHDISEVVAQTTSIGTVSHSPIISSSRYQTRSSNVSQNATKPTAMLASMQRQTLFRVSALNAFRKSLQALNIPSVTLAPQLTIDDIASNKSPPNAANSNTMSAQQPSEPTPRHLQWASMLSAVHAAIPGGVFALITDNCYNPEANLAIESLMQPLHSSQQKHHQQQQPNQPVFAQAALLAVDSSSLVPPTRSATDVTSVAADENQLQQWYLASLNDHHCLVDASEVYEELLHEHWQPSLSLRGSGSPAQSSLNLPLQPLLQPLQLRACTFKDGLPHLVKTKYQPENTIPGACIVPVATMENAIRAYTTSFQKALTLPDTLDADRVMELVWSETAVECRLELLRAACDTNSNSSSRGSNSSRNNSSNYHNNDASCDETVHVQTQQLISLMFAGLVAPAVLVNEVNELTGAVVADAPSSVISHCQRQVYAAVRQLHLAWWVAARGSAGRPTALTVDWLSLMPSEVHQAIIQSTAVTTTRIYPIKLRSAQTEDALFNALQISLIATGAPPSTYSIAALQYWVGFYMCHLPSRELGLTMAIRELVTHSLHSTWDGSALMGQVLSAVTEALASEQQRGSSRQGYAWKPLSETKQAAITELGGPDRFLDQIPGCRVGQCDNARSHS